MSLLLVEGFETFGISVVPSGIDRKYTTVNPGLMALVTGRTGGLGLELGGTNESFETFDVGSDPQTIVIGFGFKTSVVTTERIIFLREGGTNNVGITINSNGSLSVERTPTVLGTTATGLIVANTWYYIELKAKIDNALGEFELKIDETTELTGSSLDTQAGTNAWTDTVLMRGKAGSLTIYDDFYVVDTLGTKNNNFLGKSVVCKSFPNAAGDNADFTPDTGSNFARVNENPTDDDTSHVESSTIGHKDLHNHDDLSPSGIVRGIQVNTEVRDTLAVGASLKTLVKSGATLDTGPANVIAGSSYEYQTRILENDPNGGGDWTPSALDAAQIGYEVG